MAIGQIALHVSGDGQGTVVYTRREIRDGLDRIDLWAVDYDGGEPRRLTDGPSIDTHPRIAPGGGSVAFISDDGDLPAQVDVVSLETGSRHQLTALPGGVRDFDWSPDGRWLAVLAQDVDSPFEVAAAPPSADADAKDSYGVVCRVIERSNWRFDGEGLRLRPFHVHRVPVSADSTSARQLTFGPEFLSRPRVDRDGVIHVLADLREDADIAPCPQVHKLQPGPQGTQEWEQVTFLAGGVRRYHLAADGSIVAIGHDVAAPRSAEPSQAYRILPDLSHVPLLGDSVADLWVGELGGESDLHDWWTDGDDSADVTTVSIGGDVLPVRLSSGERLLDARYGCQVSSIAEHGGRTVAVLVQGALCAPEVYALEGSGSRRLTQHGSLWLDRYVLPTVERRQVPGPAGSITVYLAEPPGLVDRTAVPLVLALHGGPTLQWGMYPTLEAMILASAGYRVAMPNLRGSLDQGRHWAGSLHGAWGEVDAADAHAVLDHLIETGLAEHGRIGVCGASYGGFLTYWLAATSPRFAAAVAENGVSNQITAWSACDTGPTYAEAAGLGDPTSEEGAARLWRASPLRHAEHLNTPLLILQAEDDLRCPPADNEQMFIALRRLSRHVAYVLYPESDHLMQGTARLDRRVDRHRRVMDWFRRHLPLHRT
ncbi:prolyl oligopeptidase family serine peptidase [Streptomyces sp. NBC_01077]|uniref:S9 family peptidase n=1 Tax=Streptomyces sp. NBC_01077 TaxID=2903746 RepID=UPI003869FEF3|nr:prolyl oligopeptidase family serine peptidase [Streptomyces sp. NBC_01077]WSV43673.1 prolyl oligopeptidase family serine peptidase [Streptomyces sp. NBC_01077]